MTGADFVSSTGPVRGALQDPSGNTWSDATLLAFLTAFVRLVQSSWPELRRSDTGDLAPVLPDALGSGDTIPLPMEYITPHAEEYVLYRAFASDAKDDGNRAQAANHLAAVKVLMPDFRG